MASRNVLLTAAGLIGVITLGAACGGDGNATDVDPITAGGVGAADPTSDTTPDAPSNSTPSEIPVESVTGLDQLSGTLRSGDDVDDWEVAGVDVNFGPDGWLQTAPAFEDFDADGAAESLLEELRGLDGSEVDLGIRYEIDDDDDRDDADVYTIAGLTYRDPTGPAPWQTAADGVETTREEAVAVAIAAVGDGAVLEDIDRDDDGSNGWDVEIRDADGDEYQVLIDATGNVVDVRPDDDDTSASSSPVTTQASTDAAAVSVDTDAEIDVDDQTGDGSLVTIREVRLPSTPGFVVVRTDGPDPQILGHTAVEASGTNSTVDVVLDTPLADTTRLEAVLYADDGDGVLDPSTDRIVADEQGDRDDDRVDDDFTYTVA